MKKKRDLGFLALIYLLAYTAGFLGSLPFRGVLLKCFVFDSVATAVTFISSVILVNSSVYDPYWSLTPMVMALCLFISHRAFSFWQFAVLAVFLLWSVRLTANWISVFTDFSYEDWRYRKFRDETPRLLWPLVNFFGIHYMPTLFVFGGMLPLFRMIENPLGFRSLPGILVMGAGIALEWYADREMHRFLAGPERGSVCRIGLWNYSRHPNYLGEITVWLGLYLAMLPCCPGYWYDGIGFVMIAVMFNIISIPLMETRQKSRRPEYSEYCGQTSRLLLRPEKKNSSEVKYS